MSGSNSETGYSSLDSKTKCVSWRFLQWALMAHRNTFKARGETHVELLLGRKVRLSAFTDFHLFESTGCFPINDKESFIPQNSF